MGRMLWGVLVLAGCAAGGEGGNGGVPQPVAPAPEPPWHQAALTGESVPAVFVTEWSKAENSRSCALLAFAALGEGQGASARAATFSGGWGVAYDRPEQRSAFGIAGTGASAWGEPAYAWPDTVTWSDGSTAGYGPEGGTGPNQLAYVRVRGQTCLYNVWSRLGSGHLLFLLSQLRFVNPGG